MYRCSLHDKCIGSTKPAGTLTPILPLTPTLSLSALHPPPSTLHTRYSLLPGARACYLRAGWALPTAATNVGTTTTTTATMPAASTNLPHAPGESAVVGGGAVGASSGSAGRVGAGVSSEPELEVEVAKPGVEVVTSEFEVATQPEVEVAKLEVQVAKPAVEVLMRAL